MLHKYSYTGISTICKTNKSTWHIKCFFTFWCSYEKRKNYDYKVKFANWQNNCSCIRIYIVEARPEHFGVKSTYANQHVNVVYFFTWTNTRDYWNENWVMTLLRLYTCRFIIDFRNSTIIVWDFRHPILQLLRHLSSRTRHKYNLS